MKFQEILKITEHRPWKTPAGSGKFYQEWNDAIFLHWQVDLATLKKFVPEELEIDLFEGKPWVSLVAFTVENIRPKYLPSFSPISNFDEVNIRTYIKSGEKTGVYFLSIEAGKRLSCKVAKGISELPYRFSTIKRSKKAFECSNIGFKDQLKIQFQLGQEKTNKNELDKWLTERYALFQDTINSINEFEVHHLEWNIDEIELENIEVNYPRFNELINNKPDLTHYSKGVKVIAWGKIKKKRAQIENK